MTQLLHTLWIQLDALADRGITLEPSQLDAYRVVVAGRGGVVLQGGPGSGKTATTAGIVAAWRHDANQPVRGVAVAQQAASVLAAEAGLDPAEWSSVAALVARVQRSGPQVMAGLTIIDEASMIANRDLHILLWAANATHSRVLLLGDANQTPSVGPGGAFAAIIGAHHDQSVDDRLRAGTTATIDRNVRQHDPDEKHRVELMRAGRVGEAITGWDQAGAVEIVASVDAAIAAAAALAAERIRTRSQVLVMADTNTAVGELNHAIRTQLVITNHVGLGQRIGSALYAVGEPVLLRRNNPTLNVRNGQHGTTHIDVQLEGGSAHLPRGYAETFMDHGYASTVHLAQGKTVDTAIYVPTATNYELAVVATSRHRRTLTIVAPNPQTDRSARHHLPATGDPLTKLVAAMTRTSADTLAVVDPAQRHLEALINPPPQHARLVAELRQVIADHAGVAVKDLNTGPNPQELWKSPGFTDGMGVG